jgi:hypothetical protein
VGEGDQGDEESEAKEGDGLSREAVAVLCADLHLSRHDSAWAGRNIKGDAAFAFDQAIDHAISRGVPLVVAGDLQDESLTNTRPIEILRRGGEKLRKANQVCFYVLGNHDACDPPWPSAVDPVAFIHVHRKVFSLGPLVCRGLDYQPRAGLPAELERIGKKTTDVLVCHQGWEELLGFDGAPQGSLKDVRGVRLVVTGDLHRYAQKQMKTEVDGQFTLIEVLSPGATIMTTIAEPEDHYVHVLYDDLTTEAVQLQSRRVVRLGDLVTDADLERALESIVERVRRATVHVVDLEESTERRFPPIVHFRVAKGLQAAAARLGATLGKDACLFEQPLAEGPLEAARPVTGSNSLVGVIQALDVDHELKELLLRLVAARPEEMAAVIAAWEQETMRAPHED